MASRCLLFMAIVSTLALIGCTDPASSQLEVGSTAVVSEKRGTVVNDKSTGAIYPRLAAGVKVTVGFDPCSYKAEDGTVYTNDELLLSFRKISVVVETGEYKGVSGEVDRKDLRPAK